MLSGRRLTKIHLMRWCARPFCSQLLSCLERSDTRHSHDQRGFKKILVFISKVLLAQLVMARSIYGSLLLRFSSHLLLHVWISWVSSVVLLGFDVVLRLVFGCWGQVVMEEAGEGWIRKWCH